MSSPSSPLSKHIHGVSVKKHLKCIHCEKRVTYKTSHQDSPDVHISIRICFSCSAKRTRKPPPTLLTHQWILFRQSSEGVKLAAKWHELFQLNIISSDEEIRGNVRSFDCFIEKPRFIFNSDKLSAQQSTNNTIIIQLNSSKLRLSNVYLSIIKPLRELTEIFFHTQLAEKHPDVFSDTALQKKPYYLNAMKLLWSEPGEGQQQLHYDVPDRKLATQSYSCILYCTPCYHTAVPSAPASQLASAFNTGNILTDKMKAKNESIFHSVKFISNLVPAGSGLIFNTSVAHYGVENVMRTEKRIVIFALFEPTINKNADSMQRFPFGLKT